MRLGSRPLYCNGMKTTLLIIMTSVCGSVRPGRSSQLLVALQFLFRIASRHPYPVYILLQIMVVPFAKFCYYMGHACTILFVSVSKHDVTRVAS